MTLYCKEFLKLYQEEQKYNRWFIFKSLWSHRLCKCYISIFYLFWHITVHWLQDLRSLPQKEMCLILFIASPNLFVIGKQSTAFGYSVPNNTLWDIEDYVACDTEFTF